MSLSRALCSRFPVATTSSRLLTCSPSARRLYATSESASEAPADATATASTARWPSGITPELIERARRNVNMAEVQSEVERLENGEEEDTRPPTLEDMYDLEETLEEFKGDDSTSLGHHMLRQRREILQYFRLIELELPTLHALRKPFVPPNPSESPIIARTMTYGGIDHPVQRKAALVVPVSQLPLANDAARHKFKVLAGTRWSIEPPKDGGVGKDEITKLAEGEQGYFKISNEAFPELAMNLKWCSDVLDELVAQSNDPKDTFADIPLDTRHLSSQARKRRQGQQRLGADGQEVKRATIADFPKEWMPRAKHVRELRTQLADRERKRIEKLRVASFGQQAPQAQTL